PLSTLRLGTRSGVLGLLAFLCTKQGTFRWGSQLARSYWTPAHALARRFCITTFVGRSCSRGPPGESSPRQAAVRRLRVLRSRADGAFGGWRRPARAPGSARGPRYTEPTRKSKGRARGVAASSLGSPHTGR